MPVLSINTDMLIATCIFLCSIFAIEARSTKSTIIFFVSLCASICFVMNCFSNPYVAIIIGILYVSLSALFMIFMDKPVESPLKISKFIFYTLLLLILFLSSKINIHIPNIRLPVFAYYPEITILFITLMLFALSGIINLIKK